MHILVTFFYGLFALCCIMCPVMLAHEFGHYAMARCLRIRASVFSLGVGPELKSFVSENGMKWRLALLPFAAYVSFPDLDKASPGKRLAVVLAGPFASFVAAAMLFAMSWLIFGVPAGNMRIASVLPDSPAEAAGIQAGDLMVSVDSVRTGQLMRELISLSPDKPLTIVVSRKNANGAALLTLRVTPKSNIVATSLGDHVFGIIGVSFDPASLEKRVFSIPDSGLMAYRDMAFLTSETAHFFQDIVTGDVSSNDMVSPVGLGAIAGKVLQNSFESFMRLAAAVSFGLGLTNLLPIPALDGGHAVFAVAELCSRRRLAEKWSYGLNIAGFSCVIILFIWMMAKDTLAIVTTLLAA